MGREVTVRADESFRSEVDMGPHQLVADEPESSGGADLGPSPYDLLAASLATCKAMTLRFYANREKWPLAGSEVVVDHDRVHARDCEACETDSGYIHRFRVRIRLVGDDLTDGQRQKLLEIAGRCPVGKTLKNEIVIDDELVD